MVSYIHKIGSFINDTFVGIDGTETSAQKYSKIALGLGVAGLAAVSWKVTVTAGLLYSVYKGTEMAWNRFWPNRKVAAAVVNVAEVFEDPIVDPLHGGDDAHGDQQEQPDEQAAPLIAQGEENAPHIQVENEEDRKRRIIADLIHRKQEMMQNPRARDPNKIGLIFDAITHHSKVFEHGNNPHWLGGKIVQYAKKSNCTLRCMISYRKMKWKLKETFCCLTQIP